MTTTVTTISSGPYIADSDTTFAVTFQSTGADEIVVSLDGVEVDPGSYTFTRDADGTGEIVFATAVTGGVIIYSDPAFTQESDFQRFGAFFPDFMNAPLDRLARGLLYLRNQFARTLRFPLGTEVDELPEPVASRFLGTSALGALGWLTVPAGPAGAPGGNILSMGLFSAIMDIEIDEAVTLVITSGHSVDGIGNAFYKADATVNGAYVTAHPNMTFLSLDGRGWRIAERIIDITQAGILPGEDYAEENSDAVDALNAYLLANEPNPEQGGTPAIKLTAPADHFRFARLWEVKYALWLEGQSNALAHGYATHFDFDEAGFQFHSANTNQDGLESPATTAASGWRLENLYCSSRAAIGTGFHGLHAVTRGEAVRCNFVLFPGDGIRFESESAFGAATNNVNSSRILFCKCEGNGGNGIHLLNGDANVILTDSCSLLYNGGFGLFDNSFLSNNHRNHHTEGNGLGLVYVGHKISAVSSYCYYPIAAWASGAPIAPATYGTYRTNASKIYRLLTPGIGNATNAPTHEIVASAGGVLEADGYTWAYAGTGQNRRYHVAVGQASAASATVPGTDSSVWVPAEFAGASPAGGIPLWAAAMTWKEGGSYGGMTSAGETVWLACYEELGQPPAQIRTPALWIGGQSSISEWSTCTVIKGEQGALYNPRGFLAQHPYYDGGQLRALFGTSLSTGAVLLVAHESRHPNSFIMSQDLDTYFILDGQASNFLTMTGQHTAFTGGRSTPQVGVTNIPNLFIGDGASARSVTFAAAAPTTGYHAAGEEVNNIAPTAGGFKGWVCVTAGTPGTWKTFGPISA